MSTATKFANSQMTPNSDEEILKEICAVVSQRTGNQFGPKQMAMVDSRIKKRIHEVSVKSLAEYYDYFREEQEAETNHLVSLLTTHHTYFFREFGHFEYIETSYFDQIIPEIRARADKTLKVWSAACSRGQEVYSLAMFLDYLIQKKAPDIRYEIIGTDIDPESVKIATNGVYRRDEIKEIPLTYLKDHWVRGTGEISDFVKVKSTLKTNCKFSTLNLIKPADFGKFGTFDLIFCRNVFIYFTQEQIKSITENLLSKLHTTGRLFIGTSESLNGLNLKVQSKAPAVYAPAVAEVKTLRSTTTANGLATPASPASATSPKKGTAPVIHFPTANDVAPKKAPEKPMRVLCVDDSASILTLLKTVFTKEAGFEIVGTAINGKDAEKKVKDLKPDLMTLDIHMPEMTGIEYLEKNFVSGHCPVVMITSVSRENSELAVRALELGASDYVEKPALNQLKERTEEIRMKLKTAFRNRGTEKATFALEKSFLSASTIPDAIHKCRVLYGTLSDRNRMCASLKELTPQDPPTIILIEKSAQNLDEIARVISKISGHPIEVAKDGKINFQLGKIYVADFQTVLADLKIKFTPKKTTFLIYGIPTLQACTEISSWVASQILIEEMKDGTSHPLKARASDQFPSTSFIALSKEWLTK
jgi:chemotaxis protein methyltransferase CheR